MLAQLDPKEFLARLAPLVPPEPRDLRVSQETWDLLVPLGLLEPRAIPANKVRLALLGQLAQREPLEQRVRKGLKALRAR